MATVGAVFSRPRAKRVSSGWPWDEDVEWVVTLWQGSVLSHHKFDTEQDARSFASKYAKQERN